MQAIAPAKRLIEVALPLEDINAACAREKSIRHGHPSTLHLWWARRPLAAARAVIFAQMVDDPSAHPDEFPTEEAQERERERLFDIVRELVRWENTTDERVLSRARSEICKSWRRSHEEELPPFHDPFAGGGALPLEALRMGLEAFASDLNPVAVLINKAMIEIPQRFADRKDGLKRLAEDLLCYGQWLRDRAFERVGHLYPKVPVTGQTASARPDLAQFAGKELTVIAFLWARTVKSPDPACSTVDVPLVSTFMLSTKKGKETYLRPIVENDSYRFEVRLGEPTNEAVRRGTKVSGANFKCILSGAPIRGDYIKAEGKAGRMGARLMAVVAEGDRQRVYLPATPEMELLAKSVRPTWDPGVEISGSSQYLGIKPYGMADFADLFTARQRAVLETFASLVRDVRERAFQDAREKFDSDERSLEAGGAGACAYADTIATYIGIGLSRLANRCSTLNFWDSQGENIQHVFGRQALSMTWDFVEGNPFSDSSGSFLGQLHYLINALRTLPANRDGHAQQADAMVQRISAGKIIATDPPYFDNVPYADLSDFFYVWLRRALKETLPALFTTTTVPKEEELVAFAYRHNGKEAAGEFFMNGMSRAMRRLVEQAHPDFPVTIFYAFRQSKTGSDGTASVGWEKFLSAVVNAGFEITGTWPVRTEYTGNLKTKRNALASSIVLVCRKRTRIAATVTRHEFLKMLKRELPLALDRLQKGNIAPVDLAQALVGPGMAVFTGFERVLDANGSELRVREALTLINQTLDEILAEQEGNFDAETRFALAWFERSGFAESDFGAADVLARAKNTAVSTLTEAGIATAKGSRFRLHSLNDSVNDREPAGKRRRQACSSTWQVVHQIVRALEAGDERAAAAIISGAACDAEAARELAYRLYLIAQRRALASEARSYNGMVKRWPEILRLSRLSRGVRS